MLSIDTIHWLEVTPRPTFSGEPNERGARPMATDTSVHSTARIAIVTGGSRGLGRNTVIQLAKRGVDSILTYHTNRAEADKVVALVRETGRRAALLQLDASCVRSFDTFVQGVRSALAELG